MEADQALLYFCPPHSLKEKMGKFLYETSMLFIICVFLFTKTCNGRPFTSRTTTSSRKLIDNGRGLTPPMGWSSWNHFACNIDEDLIKQTAQAMVTTGLANLGYKYINLDDCWGELGRNSLQHVLVANPVKFPSGMAALGNYIHNLGLKFGIYSSAGNYTCSGTMPGSLGHEQADANTFASWGVDFLKYDNCYNDNIHPKIRYQAMSDALQNTGRRIFYSICEWGDQQPALWAGEFGNSWRTTDDITDDWESIMCIADMNDVYAEHAGPGAWNDPDMLEVGNGGMSYDEYVVHFSIWAISKAPLIIGCDLRNMTNDTLSILSNAEVIAVNQDPLGIQARQVRNYGQRDVWAGPLSGGRTVVLFVNKKYSTEEMTAFWGDIGVSANQAAQVRDLWLHEDLNTKMRGNLTVTLPGHSCKMFILTPTS